MIIKKLPIVLLSVLSFAANAQKKQPAMQQMLTKHHVKTFPSVAPKKTRSLERLDKMVIYRDSTESLTTTIPLLDGESRYFYKSANVKSAKTLFEYGLFFSDIVITADSVENDDNLIFFPSNTIDLYKYDNLDRLLSLTRVSKTNPLDTTNLDVYTYSGTNIEPDSIINSYNNGTSLVVGEVVRNFISNNKIIASAYYSDQGTGMALLSTDSFSYNANGDVTKTISISSFVPGNVTTLSFYNAGNMIDSISTFNQLGPIKIPLFEGKISYNTGLTNAYARIYEYNNNIKTISSSSVMKLNSLKNATESVDYIFTGPDSVGDAKSNFEYTAKGNIAKEYYTEFDIDSLKFNATSNDSTTYFYKDFSPLSNNGIAKQVIDFGLFPNPAKDAIFVTYTAASSKNAKLAIVDYTGKIVSTKDVELVNGNSILKMDISNLSKGNYLVKLITDTETAEAIKFTKE